jgi:hypothetical protein
VRIGDKTRFFSAADLILEAAQRQGRYRQVAGRTSRTIKVLSAAIARLAGQRSRRRNARTRRGASVSHKAIAVKTIRKKASRIIASRSCTFRPSSLELSDDSPGSP